MVKYYFRLKLQDEGVSGEVFDYVLDLTRQQESYVDAIFSTEIRESMRRTLQNKSSSKISDGSLNKMIQAWKQDIEEGYRETSVTLALASLISDQIEALQENGNQQMPEVMQPALATIEPLLGALPPLVFS